MESIDGNTNWKPAQEELKNIEKIEIKEELEQAEARKKLEQMIQISDDTGTGKDIRDVIMAARDYLGRLEYLNPEKALELEELIKQAENAFHSKRIKEVGLITKVDKTQKKSFRKNN